MEERGAPDPHLVRSVLDGRHEAVAELITRYQRLIAGIAWRYGVRRPEIEDLVSEVFFKMYRNLHYYRPEHAFSTWLYRLAVNHVLDHRRRNRSQRQRTEMPPELADPLPVASAALERRELSGLVRSALEEVRPRYREVLFLVYVEGLQVLQAAELLGLPQGTVKSRLMRGRQALRRILVRRHPELFEG